MPDALRSDRTVEGRMRMLEHWRSRVLVRDGAPRNARIIPAYIGKADPFYSHGSASSHALARWRARHRHGDVARYDAAPLTPGQRSEWDADRALTVAAARALLSRDVELEQQYK